MTAVHHACRDQTLGVRCSVRGATAHPHGSSTSRTMGFRRRCTLSPEGAPPSCANLRAASHRRPDPAVGIRSNTRGPPIPEGNRTRPWTVCTSARQLYRLQPRGAPRKRSLLRTQTRQPDLPSYTRIWVRVTPSRHGTRPAKASWRKAPSGHCRRSVFHRVRLYAGGAGFGSRFAALHTPSSVGGVIRELRECA